jgi:hypothetical protein
MGSNTRPASAPIRHNVADCSSILAQASPWFQVSRTFPAVTPFNQVFLACRLLLAVFDYIDRSLQQNNEQETRNKMRLLKEALGVLGALLILAVIAAFVAPKQVRAVAATLVQIVPGNTTHIGQTESRLISLRCLIGNAYCSTLDAEGNLSSTAYVVPAGYTLIVTDYEWEAFGQSPGLVSDSLFNAAGQELNGSLAVPTQANTTKPYQAYGHEHYTTGFRVGSGVTLLDFQANNSNGGSLVEGYLVPND